ncbi:hypothetical protein GQ42DRAFT_117054 [Ramicandelaber brevisporus]|nr:hypothetical protein GQ42DRAFT_117054 [Ramicandelaber brevisporus]
MSESEKISVEIGLIGAGEMGLLYARAFAAAGWQKINICDRPERFDQLRAQLSTSLPNVRVLPDGYAVSRRSDIIIYSVEAANIDAVVQRFACATKVGAVVSGQTSVKAPELAAFDKYLPEDTHIVSCHSLHGPTVGSKGQPLVIIRHRCPDDAKYQLFLRVMSSLESEMVFLTGLEHDRITADTQAVTHLAFLSMGSAWRAMGSYPWENTAYIAGIDNVKVNMSLRIYGSKWHVYAGLAIMNPSARAQVKQYAKSVSELFSLMIREDEAALRARIEAASKHVFGNYASEQHQQQHPQHPQEQNDFLERFSLSSIPKSERKPNSHLSILAMVDCWYQMKLNPYDHMVCSTPPFRFWLGIAECLFANPVLLEESITTAVNCKDFRADDLAFYSATLGWAQCIELGSFDGYQKRFESTTEFFGERIDEAKKISTQMIASMMTH